MSNNLEDATRALEAELEHAEQGVKYWGNRVNELREMVNQLKNIQKEPTLITPVVTHTREKTQQSSEKTRLPSTGGDFWLKLFTDKPQTSQVILEKAIAEIGTALDKEEKKRLAGRLATALQVLLKDKKISSVGARRHRTFTKK